MAKTKIEVSPMRFTRARELVPRSWFSSLLNRRLYPWLAERLPIELVSACGWHQWHHATSGWWACSLEESSQLTHEEVQLRWLERSDPGPKP